MPTNRTTLTGVFRIHQLKPNALFQRLVLRKELGCFEWPTMISGSLLMMALCIPNAGQVFHCDTSGSNRLSKGNYSLRCEMTEFLRYGLFSSAQPFQQTVSGTSSYTSNPCSGLTEPKATMVQTPTVNIQSLSCSRVNCSQQILLTAINPDDTATGFGFRNINFNRQNQIPNTIDQLQLGVRPIEQRQRLGFVGNGFTPQGQPFGFGAIEVSFPADRNTLLFIDRQTPLPVGLHRSIGSNHLPEQTASNLTWQFELVSDGLVELVGQHGSRRWFATVENDLRKPIERPKIVGGHFGVLGILRGNLEFVGSDGFHSYCHSAKSDEEPLFLFAEVYNNCNLLRTTGDGRQFLRWAKDPAVSLPTKL